MMKLAAASLAVVAVLASSATAFGASAPQATPGIEVDNERLVITEQPRGFANVSLMVVDIVSVTNRGKEDQAQVILPLAPGHMGLQFMGGVSPDQIVEEGDRFVDKQGLKAGETRQYRFMYGVGFPSLPNLLNRPILYPTKEFNVAVPAGEYEAEAPGLVNAGTQQMAQEVQLYRSGAPLAPNADFAITLKRAKRGINPWFWAWLALFLMPVVGIVGIRLRSSRAKRQAAAQPRDGRGQNGKGGRGAAALKR